MRFANSLGQAPLCSSSKPFSSTFSKSSGGIIPQASGEFSWLLSGITLATKIVPAKVRRAGLADILGVTGETNVQGEAVQKLDVIANQTLLQFLGNRGNVGDHGLARRTRSR